MDKGALKESIELFVLDFGYVPLDVRIRLDHGSYEIHFSIFKKTNITLKDCSRVTLALKDFLVSLLGMDDFTLDVSSPGAERILKSPLEYSLFEGKKVSISLKDGSQVLGILKGPNLENDRLCYVGVKEVHLSDVLLSDVAKCQLVLE